MDDKTKKVSLVAFINHKGKIVQIPVPKRTKTPVLAYLASKFEEDRIYSEKEINKIIDAWHTFNDYFILRRLLVDYKFLNRMPDGSAYWVVRAADKEEGEAEWTEKKS